jgi:ABC-type glycerol-3-phosphate transport system permease component
LAPVLEFSQQRFDPIGSPLAGAERPNLVNSVVIATSTTLLAVFVGSLAAYALSRFALRGKPIFMTAALLPQFFP